MSNISECVCCLGYKGTLLPFDETFWMNIKSASKRWLLYGQPYKMVQVASKRSYLWDKSFEELDKKFGYHSKCRTTFTNVSKLHDAQTKYENTVKRKQCDESDAEAGPSPAKTRRSSQPLSSSSTGILDAKCIVCLKALRWYRKFGKNICEKLSNCESLKGGLFFNLTSCSKICM